MKTKKEFLLNQHVFFPLTYTPVNKTSLRVFLFSLDLFLYLLIEMEREEERMKILFFFFSCKFLFVLHNLGTILMKSVVCDEEPSCVEMMFCRCRFHIVVSLFPLFFFLSCIWRFLTRQIPYQFQHTRLIEFEGLVFFWLPHAWLRSSFVIENCMFCSGYSPKASINIPLTTECALYHVPVYQCIPVSYL